MNREQYVLEFAILTFVCVLIGIGLTIWIIRILHSRKAVVDNKEVLDAIEGVRQQQSAEHSAMQGEQRSQGGAIRQLLDRFGFMKRIK